MAALRNPKHEKVALALFAGQDNDGASAAAGYDTKASSFSANANKRAQRHGIPERLAELRAEHAVKDEQGAGLSLDYMLAKLRHLVDYNVADYLTPPGEDGRRNYSISGVSREALGRLSELTLDEFTMGKDTKVFRTRVKGHDPVAIMTLGAKLQGLIKDKHEHAGPDGGPMSVISKIEQVIVDPQS